MSPYLLLGFFFAGVLKVWFPQKWVDKYMGKNNARSVINTALLGIPLPLCSCGVIPTGISFYKNGASKGSSVSFLISTPQTGIDSILVTYSLLGLPFALIRVLVALVTGIFGGIITNLIGKNESSNIQKAPTNCCSSSKNGSSNSFIKVFKYGFNKFLMDIAKWLIIGIVIAAFLSTLIPEDFFSVYMNNELLSIITILIASVPLYLCATASVPIAAVLMMKGLSPGAALVLLMAGPATNAATIIIIKKVFGNKTLMSYLGSIISGAVIFGLLINHFLPSEWFQMISSSHLQKQHELLPDWLKLGSSFVLISLIIYGYIRKKITLKKSQQRTSVKTVLLNPQQHLNSQQPIKFSSAQFSFVASNQQATYKIEGMTCSHCKSSIENNLKKLEGIEIVKATPMTNKVEIKGAKINKQQIEETINSLGFNFKGDY